MMRILGNSNLQELLDEIISIVAKRGEISIKEVEQGLPMTRESTRDAIDFLVKYDFLRLMDGKYLSLTEASMPLIDESIY